MKFILTLLTLIVSLAGCASVSESLTDVRAASVVTDEAITQAKSGAEKVSSEAEAITRLAEKTGDSVIIAAAQKHIESTKALESDLALVKASHAKEVDALSKADSKIQALEAHDTVMTGKAKSAFWRIAAAYTVAAVCVVLLLLVAFKRLKSSIPFLR